MTTFESFVRAFMLAEDDKESHRVVAKALAINSVEHDKEAIQKLKKGDYDGYKASKKKSSDQVQKAKVHADKANDKDNSGYSENNSNK